MKVRYQADADLDRRIVRATRRREPAIDFQLASEAQTGRGLRGLPDEQVLILAAQEGRILVTHDHRTMPGHFAGFVVTATSPGVIVLPQRMPLIEESLGRGARPLLILDYALDAALLLKVAKKSIAEGRWIEFQDRLIRAGRGASKCAE